MPPVANAPRTRRFVNEFGPAERIEGVFAIANAQLGRTKTDKPFLKALISTRPSE